MPNDNPSMPARPDDSSAVGIVSPYRRWVQNRTISSFGTNDKATPIAFQKWHHFKEAFPPELVAHAVNNSSRTVGSCLDPFGGSGTTALTCQMLGIDSTTVEINPFLVDVISAKVGHYDIDNLASSLVNTRRLSRKSHLDPRAYFGTLPGSFLEPGIKKRWVFDQAVAERLAAILHAIDTLEAESDRRLFRIIVGGMLSEVSNVVVSGKGRRYKRNWQESRVDAGYVDALFAKRAELAILDIQTFKRRPAASSTILRGDSRQVPLDGPFDLSVFSPPYPNSFDYTDVYNLELWMLGYLKSWEDNRALRTSTLSSHVQLSRTYAPRPAGSPILDEIIDKLQGAKEELWSPHIPAMVGSYFTDLVMVIDKVHDSLHDDGRAWIVIGDSRYSGVIIPVASILEQLGRSRRWRVESQEAIRHMKSSAQQGWVPELAESLVVTTRS